MTYNWVPVSLCQPKLDAAKFSRLSDSDTWVKPKVKILFSGLLGTLQILYGRQVMPLRIYRRNRSLEMGQMTEEEDDESIEEFVNLVGKEAAETLVLFRE